MILSDYFEPVDFSKFKRPPNRPDKHSLGAAIEKTVKKFSDNFPPQPAVALIGVPVENSKKQQKKPSTPDKIRQYLYQLTKTEKRLNVIDLGNLKPATTRKGTFLALRDVVEYLREANVTAIVFGKEQELTTGLCEAFKNNRFFWLTAVDALLDIKKGNEKFDSSNYLTRIFNNIPDLFHFSLIGYQNHMVGETRLDQTPGIGEHLRLGQLRDDISRAELLLRPADVLTFDMGVVRHSDAPSTPQKNPNGLFGEEACHLARYAGLSPKLSVFGLFEVTGEDEQTPRLAAEILWYFLEGVSRRTAVPNKTVYKVEMEELDHPLIFLHDPASNRWWFEAQSVSGECMEVPCPEDDYRQAAENEIPARWLHFVQKMDLLLKRAYSDNTKGNQ